jgi:hypothetical protein
METIMKAQQFPEHDPRRHTANIKAMLHAPSPLAISAPADIAT